MRKQDKYKLPRKKKKALKLKDPELYRLRCAIYKIKEAAIAVSRFGEVLRLTINSVGGSIENGMALLSELQDVDSPVECKIDVSNISMASAIATAGPSTLSVYPTLHHPNV